MVNRPCKLLALCLITVLIMLFMLFGCAKKTQQNIESNVTTDAQSVSDDFLEETEDILPDVSSQETQKSDLPNIEIWDDWTGGEQVLPTNPTEPTPTVSTGIPPDITTDTGSAATYEDYMNMTAAQKQAFFESFDSLADFRVWYNQAYSVFQQENAPDATGDGNVDLEDYLNTP